MKALNDREMLYDIMYHLKDLMTMYGTALKESNCQKMRDMVTTLSGQVATHQFEMFNYMNKNGMYPVFNAPAAEIKQTIKMHK